MEEETRAHLTEAEKSQLPPHNLPAIRARILNHEPVLQLKTLKANYYGNLGVVAIPGNTLNLMLPQCNFENRSCVLQVSLSQSEELSSEWAI